jgi:hypothetical protein
MYRQIFIPTKQNRSIQLPEEWLGRKVEVIAFPVPEEANSANELEEKTKLELLDKALNKYLISFPDFKFNRNEANNYE